MFTLVLSEGAARQYGYNTAVTTSGDVVNYTCMVDEVEYGGWELHYFWEDAVKVGECESYRSIISINKLRSSDRYKMGV